MGCAPVPRAATRRLPGRATDRGTNPRPPASAPPRAAWRVHTDGSVTSALSRSQGAAPSRRAPRNRDALPSRLPSPPILPAVPEKNVSFDPRRARAAPAATALQRDHAGGGWLGTRSAPPGPPASGSVVPRHRLPVHLPAVLRDAAGDGAADLPPLKPRRVRSPRRASDCQRVVEDAPVDAQPAAISGYACHGRVGFSPAVAERTSRSPRSPPGRGARPECSSLVAAANGSGGGRSQRQRSTAKPRTPRLHEPRRHPAELAAT